MLSFKKVYFLNDEIKLPVLFLNIPVFDYVNHVDFNDRNIHYPHHNDCWFVQYGVYYKQYGLYPLNAIGKIRVTPMENKVKFFKTEQPAKKFYKFIAKRDHIARSFNRIK